MDEISEQAGSVIDDEEFLNTEGHNDFVDGPVGEYKPEPVVEYPEKGIKKLLKIVQEGTGEYVGRSRIGITKKIYRPAAEKKARKLAKKNRKMNRRRNSRG